MHDDFETRRHLLGNDAKLVQSVLGVLGLVRRHAQLDVLEHDCTAHTHAQRVVLVGAQRADGARFCVTQQHALSSSGFCHVRDFLADNVACCAQCMCDWRCRACACVRACERASERASERVVTATKSRQHLAAEDKKHTQTAHKYTHATANMTTTTTTTTT